MKTYLSILFLFFTGILFSQDLYLISFSEKENTAYFLENPEEMLSQKALDRRDRFGIALDEKDVPLETAYVEAVANTGVEMIGASKWFNGVFAWCTDEQIQDLQSLDFVAEVHSFVNQPVPTATSITPRMEEKSNSFQSHKNLDANYPMTQTQIEQINLQALHEQGFTGEGMDIAMFDNGFMGVNTLEAFAYIRDLNRIKNTFNFVNKEQSVYANGEHGTMTLSTIGGYLENQFMGTAIDANFYLFVTENNQHEMPDEEVNWILAAEKADSLGIDVINSSLGYYDFDDPRYNYVYEDMDGATTYVSRGAQIAAEKGIMVVNSAGNEGFNDWHYIIAPSDAEDVFSIGAVDEYGYPAWFTSWGPTPDNRIKPDVAAMGQNAGVVDSSMPRNANGTSFSSPIMAGAITCLMQAFPNSLPSEIRQTVRETGHLYDSPSEQLGYGIPDFGDAYQRLILSVDPMEKSVPFILYPNPTEDWIHIETELPISGIRLVSFEGKIIKHLPAQKSIDLSSFPQGVYFMNVTFENGRTVTKRFIKK